ncbi:PREDICTED: protein NLRC3-like isoform X1 [Acropora digitifera]|uniref:protein NLRC3-like isoform X1 n=1 Tax=Acropora digitifera TaxID=70779 RepID=UPI00077A47FF|nr:PREDICTED: protein NLRC3-like isoform X1 [Acropora digitifera]
MESLKDLLTAKPFNRISYVAVICWILYGVILLSTFADIENSDSFRCEAKLEKIDVVRGKCSDQYKNRYNKSGIPVYGFVIANFSFIGVVCVIYYQVVKSRVDEVEANRQRADAERPNNDGSRHKRRKLFVAYLCQLATRIVIGIVFIVLQTLVLYPDNFPSDYHCQIAAASHAVNASSTSNIQNSTMYECYNQQASKITSWMNAVIVGNIVWVLIILIEIICILAQGVKKGKEFLEDSVFIKYLLNLPTREPQEPEHEQQQLIESQQISQEEEPQERVSTQEQPQDPERQDAQEEDSEQVRLSPMGPQEQQLQQPSVIAGFIESQRKSIREGTEKDRGLKPLFQDKPGQGKRIEAFKLDHIYTNLSLVKDIARYKITGNREEQLKVFPMPQEKFQQITRQEIVDAKNKKILIVGRPGIGKTLFLTKWIRDWSSDKAFNGELHFKFAFFLKFREFNSQGELSLRRLLSSSEYSETDLSDQVWNDICENPERVLIFFDGLDESLDRSSVAEASHCNNLQKQMPLSALFYNIVEGNLLRGASVLTTTRPGAVEEVTNLPFDKTIEILGFASEQVEEYVEKFVKVAAQDVVDAGKKIWEHIKTNMNLFSLCYIPVNCLIICSCLLQVLKFHGEKALTGVGLPTKLTEIYQICVKLFFLRHNEHRNKDLLQKDINSKHLPPEVEEKIRPLAKLAFDGLAHVKKRLIFGEKEVPEDLADIALFHRLEDSKPNPFRSEAQYCFIHLTMQEFLAAKHITETMKGEELRTFVADHIKNGEWQLVLQFVAGLLGEQSIDIFTDLLPKTTEKKDESVLMFDYSLKGRTVTCWPTKSEKDLALTLLKCIHETNVSGSVVESKLEEIGFNAVDFSYCRLAPADCTAVVHFIKHIQQISLINLSFNNIGSLGCVEIVKLFDNTNCQLRGLNLRYNNMDDEGVEKLSDVLVNSQLSSLNLGENNITDEGVKQLSNVLVNSQLSSLSLGDNNIGDEGVKQLSNALVKSQLSSLNLWDNNITDEGVKQLSNVLVKSQLSSLVIGQNYITDEGVRQLSNVLVNSNTLRRLNLNWNDEVTDEAKEQIRQANPNCKVSI